MTPSSGQAETDDEITKYVKVTDQYGNIDKGFTSDNVSFTDDAGIVTFQSTSMNVQSGLGSNNLVAKFVTGSETISVVAGSSGEYTITAEVTPFPPVDGSCRQTWQGVNATVEAVAISDTEVSPEQDNVVIGKFILTNSSGSESDSFCTVVINNNGTAGDGEISELKLYYGDNKDNVLTAADTQIAGTAVFSSGVASWDAGDSQILLSPGETIYLFVTAKINTITNVTEGNLLDVEIPVDGITFDAFTDTVPLTEAVSSSGNVTIRKYATVAAASLGVAASDAGPDSQGVLVMRFTITDNLAPDELTEICRKALSKNPKDRFDNASYFSQALSDYLEGAKNERKAEEKVSEANKMMDLYTLLF